MCQSHCHQCRDLSSPSFPSERLPPPKSTDAADSIAMLIPYRSLLGFAKTILTLKGSVGSLQFERKKRRAVIMHVNELCWTKLRMVTEKKPTNNLRRKLDAEDETVTRLLDKCLRVALSGKQVSTCLIVQEHAKKKHIKPHCNTDVSLRAHIHNQAINARTG